MARRKDDLTEQEAREELARRNRGYRRDPYGQDEDRAWWAPDAQGYGTIPASGQAWPMPPYPYPERRAAEERIRRDRMDPWHDRDHAPRGYRERGMLDRAGDEVASWFGDEGAEARREEDHRGRGPKDYVRSDDRIAEDVNDRLTDDRDVDASEIEVSVRDREVTLNGSVHSRRAKRAAEDCADSVSGVVHVQNNLRVNRTGAA